MVIHRFFARENNRSDRFAPQLEHIESYHDKGLPRRLSLFIRRSGHQRLSNGAHWRKPGEFFSSCVLFPGGGQMSLFNAAPRQKDRNLAAALDDITPRFGSQAITRAALVPKKRMNEESSNRFHTLAVMEFLAI
jgi:hypothetical protein